MRDGHALGRQFAEHDVQHGDQREGQRRRQCDPCHRGLRAQHGREQMLERGLADDAEADAGDGDAQLACGQVGVEVGHRVAQRARPTAPRVLQLGQLGRAHPGQRELGGDEERVGEHERGRDKEVGDDGQISVPDRLAGGHGVQAPSAWGRPCISGGQVLSIVSSAAARASPSDRSAGTVICRLPPSP